MGIKTNIQSLGLRKAYDYVDKDPINRLPKLVDIFSRFVPSGEYSGI